MHKFFLRGFLSLVALCASSVALAQSGVAATTDLSLYVVEQCASLARGGRCGLSLVQVPSSTQPQGQIARTCAPGWVAHVKAERGTVEQGGVNRGQAVVCGYEKPEEAIRALFIACDKQTLGICQDANHVDVQWGYWSGSRAELKDLPMNKPLQIASLPKATRCVSAVPLVESATCGPAAAVLLRKSGLR